MSLAAHGLDDLDDLPQVGRWEVSVKDTCERLSSWVEGWVMNVCESFHA